MIIVKATKDSEAGVMPEAKLIADMADYHEQLQKAGVLLDASGLQPSSNGWRIKYSGGEAHRSSTVRRLPKPRELVAGYTIINVKSQGRGARIDRRFPNPAIDGTTAKSRFVSCSSCRILVPERGRRAFSRDGR